MRKLLLLFALLSILFSQEPPKNQFSLGIFHQLTNLSINYEDFFYKYNSIEYGLAFESNSFINNNDGATYNLAIPINYKIYLTRIKFLEASLGHTFILNKRSISTLAFAINTNLEEGLNIRFALYFPLAKREKSEPSEMNFTGLKLLSLRVGYRF